MLNNVEGSDCFYFKILAPGYLCFKSNYALSNIRVTIFVFNNLRITLECIFLLQQ